MMIEDRKYSDSKLDSSQMGGNAVHPGWVWELEKPGGFFMQQVTSNKVKRGDGVPQVFQI